MIWRSSAGFTLVEVTVALALLVVVSVGVVRLFAIGIEAGRASRDRTIALSLATGKIEQLRSLEWRLELDSAGAATPRTDTTTNLGVDPPGAGGPGLSESPAGTLDANMPPYVDYLDRHGRWAGAGTSAPGNAVYLRRWAIHRLPADPDGVVILQVLVTSVRLEGSRRGAVARAWNGEEVILATMMARRAR
jgi:prepilin-type N-terminal cleavage/methylation domain-containing protein